MGFPIPDLIIESVIRDGMQNVRNDPEVLEDVFLSLTQPFASKKYGEAEIEKIKRMLQRKEISIVHAFSAVSAKIPCISIQLAEEVEDEKNAKLGDAGEVRDFSFEDPADIAGTTILSDVEALTYDSNSGIITVPDTVNLSDVHINLIYTDVTGEDHVIVGGVDNTLGQKQFRIDADAELTLGVGSIKTSIDFDRYLIGQAPSNITVIVGIHTNDPLITKYLYILMKYFLLSRKEDICSRGIQLSTYSGSDFNRNMDYGADMVFTRFLNVKGKIFPTWRKDKAVLIDNIELNIKVPKDKYGNTILGIEDQTVNVNDDDD